MEGVINRVKMQNPTRRGPLGYTNNQLSDITNEFIKRGGFVQPPAKNPKTILNIQQH